MRTKMGVTILVSVLAILAVLGVLAWNMQDRQLYYPHYSEPSVQYLKQKEDFYTEITISTVDGQRYVGWMHGDRDAVKPAVLLFGGNGMSAAATFAYMDAAQLWNQYGDVHFVMVDYPGYGLSTGRPSETGIYEMALAAYDQVAQLENVDADRIYALGFSLGTAPAVYLGAKRDCAGILLLAPFDNGIGLANQHYPYFYGPLRSLVKNKLPSDEYAPAVEEEVLILASEADETVGIRLSKQLAARFPREPHWQTFTGLTHNQIFFDETVIASVRAFIEQREQ